mmetsp:Transcript_21966/g.64693  ORF Transcript_21966/g.64693 Transcript_21966/m.64693 type:complete len:201 (-) Transcript_21966:1977-2579(-)
MLVRRRPLGLRPSSVRDLSLVTSVAPPAPALAVLWPATWPDANVPAKAGRANRRAIAASAVAAPQPRRHHHRPRWSRLRHRSLRQYRKGSTRCLSLQLRRRRCAISGRLPRHQPSRRWGRSTGKVAASASAALAAHDAPAVQQAQPASRRERQNGTAEGDRREGLSPYPRRQKSERNLAPGRVRSRLGVCWRGTDTSRRA